MEVERNEKRYLRTKRKLLEDKKLVSEIEILEEVIQTLVISKNLFEAIKKMPPKRKFEQKKGNLREYFSARLNSKIRLISKPDYIYPYDYHVIERISLVEINDHNYDRL